MAKQIYVSVEIITKKGEEKKVKFYMDEGMYKAILTTSEEEQKRFFADEYYDYEAQRRYNRKTVSLDVEDDSGIMHEIEDKSTTPLEQVICEHEKELLNKALSSLKERYRYVITEIYINNRKQVDVAKKLGIDKTTLSKLKKVGLEKLRKFFEEN